MNKFSLFSLLLIGSVFSLSGQQNADIKVITENLKVASSKGIVNFSSSNASEFPDSVVRYEYLPDRSVPNINRTLYYYSAERQLDSVLEFFHDNLLQYASGHTTAYLYDDFDRIIRARKVSWNSQIKDLKITIEEEYEYAGESDYTRYSHIAWTMAAHTSTVLVREEYAYDAYDDLTTYTMHVPPEINPDSVTYLETYQYDAHGNLIREKKDLCIKDASIQHTEKEYQVKYNSEMLPRLIQTSERSDGEAEWKEVGQAQFFYDDERRNTKRLEYQIEESGQIFKKQLFHYNMSGQLVREMSYAGIEDGDYSLVDSTVYFYSSSIESITALRSVTGIRIFPNPSDGWIHVQCDIAYPAEIRIFDAAGKAVYTIEQAMELTDIDLTNYPPGIYTVTLTNRQGFRAERVLKY